MLATFLALSVVLSALLQAGTTLAAPVGQEGTARAADLSHMTITIVNKHTAAVSTTHASNAGPTPISGGQGAGTLAKGAQDVVVVPQDWAGNIQFVEAGGSHKIVGDESWLEGSLKEVMGKWMVGVDVSYVNGFSVPITCTCDEDNKFLSGCNKDLWTMSTCPQNNGMGSCKNPLRVPLGKQEPTPFFKPCEAKAYTYPSDDMAMSEGTCQDGRVTCCVGTAC